VKFDKELDTQIRTPVSGESFSNQLLKTLEDQKIRSPSVIEMGGIRLDAVRGVVSVASEDLKLGSTEVRLLGVLLANTDITLNRSQLLDRVWGRAIDIEERTVDVHVSRIRNRLSAFGLQNQIQTVRGRRVPVCFGSKLSV
jgi:DNA-binding response OmpR family regulator